MDKFSVICLNKIQFVSFVDNANQVVVAIRIFGCKIEIIGVEVSDESEGNRVSSDFNQGIEIFDELFFGETIDVKDMTEIIRSKISYVIEDSR
ncbi:MAG: hypothetical protein BWY95_01077 [Bacteroidetes bacterium ADurb.BinA104]|nr:MAG: hypothetical protein BWY95_01077 [Bacteroidetes bacterium ADurb.BinA104]